MNPARTTYPTRLDWLRARRIGSSDVPAILGVSRYATRFDVWDRLVNGVDDEGEPNEAQSRGLRLEPRVLATYERETGRTLERIPPHTLWSRDRWATSTPDSLVVDDPDEGIVNLEVKTDRDASRWGPPATIARWDDFARATVRPDYYLQTQHQMWTLELGATDLAVLLPGDDPFLPELRVYRVIRDEALVERMVARCSEFWDRHVATRLPPPIDHSEAAGRLLAQLYRGGRRRATAEEVRVATAYLGAAQMEKTAKDEKRKLGRWLVASAGTTRELELPSGRVTVVAGQSSDTLDEHALLAEHPELEELLARYRRSGAPFVYPRVTVNGGRK